MDTVQDDRHTNWGWFYYRIVDDFGPVIKADGVAVYMVLVRHASNEGRLSYPAIPTIAQKLGISARQVRYVLDRLVAAGLIAIAPRMAATANGKSRQTSNLYRLLPLPDAPPANIAAPASVAPDPLQILQAPPANIAPELDSRNKTQKERESVPAPATGDISPQPPNSNGHTSNGTSPGRPMNARPVLAADETPPPVVVKVPPGTPVNRRPDAPALRPVPKPDPASKQLAKWFPPDDFTEWYAEVCTARKREPTSINLIAELQKFRVHPSTTALAPGQWDAHWQMWILRAFDGMGQPRGPAPPRRRSVDEVDL